MKTKILFVFIMFCLISCKNSDKLERENQPDIYHLEDNDKEMAQAIIEANETLSNFNLALANPKIEVKSLKVKFESDNGNEHIWLSNVTYKNGKYSGVLDNEPEDITEHKIGDKIAVDSKNISDWMYLEDGKLFGGYTIKVLRNRMSAPGRNQFDAESGMQID